MTQELSGRRVVVPETRELGQLVRMLEELGAATVSCPMIAIRDVPDIAPVEAWLRRFADGTCDDLVLMTGEGLRRLLGFARRDEFAVLSYDVDRDTAYAIGLRFIATLQSEIRAGGHSHEIGASIGAALIPDDGTTAEEIIHNADLAMYRAKGQDRPSLVFSEPAASHPRQIA